MMNYYRFGMDKIAQAASLKNAGFYSSHVWSLGVPTVGACRQLAGYSSRTCFPGSNALSWAVWGLNPAPVGRSGWWGRRSFGVVAERFRASTTAVRGVSWLEIYCDDDGDGTVGTGREFPVGWFLFCCRIVKGQIRRSLNVRWSRSQLRSICF